MKHQTYMREPRTDRFIVSILGIMLQCEIYVLSGHHKRTSFAIFTGRGNISLLLLFLVIWYRVFLFFLYLRHYSEELCRRRMSNLYCYCKTC